eukprot:354691-Chlamydomonas_euryale.AAC.16
MSAVCWTMHVWKCVWVQAGRQLERMHGDASNDDVGARQQGHRGRASPDVDDLPAAKRHDVVDAGRLAHREHVLDHLARALSAVLVHERAVRERLDEALAVVGAAVPSDDSRARHIREHVLDKLAKRVHQAAVLVVLWRLQHTRPGNRALAAVQRAHAERTPARRTQHV